MGDMPQCRKVVVGGRDCVIIVQPVLGMRWEEGCRDTVEVVKHVGS